MPFTLIRPRSTGRWDLTAAMNAIAPISSGQFIVEREGDTVWLDFQELDAAPQGTSFALWENLLPAGLRPPTPYVGLGFPRRSAADTAGPCRISRGGQVVVYAHTGTIRGLVSFRTSQAMISTVPGGVKL